MESMRPFQPRLVRLRSNPPSARTRRRPAWPVVVAAALGGFLPLVTLPGCNDPEARTRLAARQQSFNWAANSIVQRERENPERLRQDLAFVNKSLQEDARKLDRDVHDLQRYLDYDIRRWQERQPAYREKIKEILRGHPENIEHNAIIMFL